MFGLQDVVMIVVVAVLQGPTLLQGSGDLSAKLLPFAYAVMKQYFFAKAAMLLMSWVMQWRESSLKKDFLNKPISQEVTGLQFIKGEPVQVLGSLKDPSIKRVFVLEAWATWCGPCVHSAPHLSKIANKYADKHVYVIGITDEVRTIDKVKAFVDKMGNKMSYIVAVDAEENARRIVFDKTGAMGIPNAVIFNVDGMPVWSGHPMDPKFEATLEREAALASPRKQ